MNILLMNGHGWNYNINPKKYDGGATGNGYKEAELTRELADIIQSKLKVYCNVYRYAKDRNAFEDCRAGTFAKNLPISYSKIDYALEIHFNAFKKDETKDRKMKGTECYVTTSESGITAEQTIMKNLSKFFPLRDNDSIFDGVKRTNFLVIQTLKDNGVSGALFEICFIDDADDISTYQANKNAIADAIVNGIVSEFGLKKTATSTSTNTSTSTIVSGNYRVVKDIKGYTNADNAKNRKNATVTVKAGTYHIYKEYNGMKNVAKTKGKPGAWINPADNVATVKKSIAEVAREVIDGKWGNGNDRKTRLEKAGYNYNEVQAKVNQLLK